MANEAMDMSPEASSEDSSSMVYASLDSLAAEDGTQPAVGDEVEISVKGTISEIKGDVACVTASEVNGEPVPSGYGDSQDSAQSGPEDMASRRDRLMKKAQAADEA